MSTQCNAAKWTRCGVVILIVIALTLLITSEFMVDKYQMIQDPDTLASYSRSTPDYNSTSVMLPNVENAEDNPKLIKFETNSNSHDHDQRNELPPHGVASSNSSTSNSQLRSTLTPNKNESVGDTEFELNASSELPHNESDIVRVGQIYANHIYSKYQSNHSVFANHPNRCKIPSIEANHSAFHEARQKRLPYIPRNIDGHRYRSRLIESSSATTWKLDENDYNFSIALCMRMQNELRYLPEWIEYHKFVQNIDEIWLLDNQSKDRVWRLANVYNASWLKIFRLDWRGYDQCLGIAQQRNITYVAVWDADEFAYPINTSYINIKHAIDQEVVRRNFNTSWIVVGLIGYGTYTDDEPFKYDVDDNDSVINGNDGIQTVIGRYLYRAPTRWIEGQPFVNAVRKTTQCRVYGRRRRRLGTACGEGNTIKSITKAADCASLFTHSCGVWNWNMTKDYVAQHRTRRDVVRGHHYLYRNHQHFFQYGEKPMWGKNSKWIGLLTDINEKFFNAIYDPILADRYYDALTQRMYNLLGCNHDNATRLLLN